MNPNPILVNIYRGNVLESFHRGVVCVVDRDNKIIFSCGDVQQVCYPRSALKFFQQIPLLSSNAFQEFGFTLKEIAIMCGSHNGEEDHIETVRNILNKIGLSENDLECGEQMPTLKKDQVHLIKNDLKPQKIHNNCSGKHAGFLAYCVFNNLTTKNYIDFNHPLHQTIIKTVSEFYEYPLKNIQVGIDGCSAPIFAFPVLNQAIAYKNLVNSEKFGNEINQATKLMLQAVSEYPEMIAGTNRYCSDLIRETKGKVIGKTGADGVYSLSIPHLKYGISIKIDDGKMGPQYNVAQSLLEKMNLIDEKSCEKLKCYLIQENKNFGQLKTGETMTTDFLNLIEKI